MRINVVMDVQVSVTAINLFVMENPGAVVHMFIYIVGFCSYELRTPIRADIVSFPPYENRNLREIK